jgi:endonuclease YncB( thermonuclease family)
MSGITLSSSVRQNLLSLQSTADLLSTTQSRLSTGNKVNSALDNPTNFFTAQGLNNRASDINNLLDGIGNGVQILQAANTGITSLQKLVDSAKSIANQALQATGGYSTKSQAVSVAIDGATASNLLGNGTLDATATSTAATMTATAAFTNTTATAGAQLYSGSAVNADPAATALSALTTSAGAAAGVADGDTLTVNGKTITFGGTGTTLSGSGTAFQLGKNSTLSELATAINTLQGAGAAGVATGGLLTLSTGTDANLAVSGSALTKLGLAAAGANTAARGGGAVTTPALTGAAKLSGTNTAGALSTGFAAGDTLTVNGKTLSFVASGATGDQINITDDVTALVGKIDAISGGTSTISGGKVNLHTGTGSDLKITSSNTAALASLGVGTSVTQARSSVLEGKTLSFAATAGGTAVNITLGSGANQVDTLDKLNTALAANNQSATISSDGKLTITTTNDFASSTMGAITGSAVGTSAGLLGSLSVTDPVKDANAQNTRASLVAQYNTVMDQIRTTAADSSFNGVNLLNGDTLALTFNETGKSKLSIQGVTFDTGGLGLEKLTGGTDFLDNSATNKVLSSLNNASSSLRSQASAFGSNLSVVQMRQDFSKQMINVLQTGASNLTLADTNEEAANSQALSTRQSIAVSALSLANQSQQGVLQLLR